MLDYEMKIAMMEKHSPELLEHFNMGECRMKIIHPRKKSLFKKAIVGKIIILSDVLYKLEKESTKLLEEGHEVIEPISVHNTKYKIVFSYNKNPNSSYLELKKTTKKLKETLNKIK